MNAELTSVDILPIGWFSNTIGYGVVYNYEKILSQVETSYTMITALIATDVVLQTGQHLRGAMRGGASLEEVKGIRAIAIEVAKAAGVSWKKGVPEVEDLLSGKK